jgi:hypothetical protein
VAHTERNTERDRDYDNEVAELTDAVLERSTGAGESMTASAMTRDLQRVIIQLRDVIDPDTPPDPGFSASLSRRLGQEFDLMQRPNVRKWPNQRMVQLVGMAAAIIVVLGIGIFFSGSEVSSDSSTGTAFGDISVVEAIVLGVVAFGTAGIVFLLSKRQR